MALEIAPRGYSKRFASSAASSRRPPCRIKELEEIVSGMRMRSMEYAGTWKEERAPFREGQVVTHNGTIWYCKRFTLEKPPSDSWTLMVKNKHG
jgi:hypothetical protein